MIIAQISDIHAGPNNDNLRRLEKAMAWLNALKPDCLVVSGDLVDGRWHQGYREIGVQLEEMQCQLLILPGNSDDGPIMSSLLGQHVVSTADASLHFSAIYGDTFLIGLDTTVKGEAHGEVSNHLPWLRRQLEMYENKQTILFTHHHVFPSGIAPMDDVMCRDAALLAELLSSVASKPLAVCSGHVHRGMSGLFAGIPAYICGSICPPNPLLLYGCPVPPVEDTTALLVHQVNGDRLVSSHISLS